MVDQNNKKSLRIYLKKIRLSIPIQQRETASFAACQELYQKIGAVEQILSFASIGSEINLWDLNHKLMSENRLVLPKREGNHLALHLVNKKEQLKKNSWGFYEPTSDCMPIDANQIGIGLIPGLGFDLHTKHRLGYGKGLYDQFLSTCRIQKIWGIGFKEQSLEEFPYGPLDIPMDEIYLF